MIDYPHLVQAALLFDRVGPLDVDRLVREFIATEAAAGTQYKLFPDTKPGIFYRLFGSNDVMVTVEHVGKPAKLSLFEAALTSPFVNMATPDARERLARHRSHILVAAHTGPFPPTPEIMGLLGKLEMPAIGQSAKEFRLRMTVCSNISTMVHRANNAELVHWTLNNHLMRGDMFEAMAAQPVPCLLHIHLILLDGATSADGRQQVEILTVGARHFIGREIHVAATPVPWVDVLDGIFAFVKIGCLDRGYIVPDGDTFGPDDGTYSYGVSHIETGEQSGGFAGPLFRLDLLYSREHDFKAPGFVTPVCRFTDRNVPPDIMEQLGEDAESAIQKWRTRRSMAEAAGNRFEVRFNRQASPPENSLS